LQVIAVLKMSASSSVFLKITEQNCFLPIFGLHSASLGACSYTPFLMLKSVIKICVTIYLATFYSSAVILMHKWPSVLTGILIFSIFSPVFIVTECPGHLFFTTSSLPLVPFKHMSWSDGIFSICLT